MNVWIPKGDRIVPEDVVLLLDSRGEEDEDEEEVVDGSPSSQDLFLSAQMCQPKR